MVTGVDRRTGLRSPRGPRAARGWRAPRQVRPKSPARLRGLAWPAALGIAVVALFLLALSQSRSTALSSDGASNILQAQAMLHGNPLLRGWWTSDVSFYTTELPEYALVVAARGVSPDVVHICGALTYTLAVALAALLARGPARGAAGRRRAAIAVAIMLAPSVLGGTEVFLEEPDHFGTSVPVLLALLLLDRAETGDGVAWPRWRVAVGLGALLAWTQIGDELSLVTGTAAIAVVSAVRLAAAARRPRPSAPRPDAGPVRDGLRWNGARRNEAHWDGMLVAAALLSIAVARTGGWALRSAGGFDLRPIPGARLASLGQLPGNAAALYQSLILLFGANNPGKPRQPLTISHHVPLVLSADVHVIGLLVAGAGLVAGIAACRSGARLRNRVDQILVAAIVITIAAALLSGLMQSLTSAHEVAILLPLGAVLAGRTLPSAARRLVARLAARPGSARPGSARPGSARPSPAAARTATRTVTTAATVALAGWLAAGVAEAGYGAAWPPTPLPVQGVAAWLVAHHLRDGLAAYWQGTETTVATGGRVLVAPVTAAGTAVAHWETSSAWYQPGRYRPTFVIAQPHPAQPEDSLPLASVRARFGAPAAEYHVGRDVVLVYGYNLLTRLQGRTFPGSS